MATKKKPVVKKAAAKPAPKKAGKTAKPAPKKAAAKKPAPTPKKAAKPATSKKVAPAKPAATKKPVAKKAAPKPAAKAARPAAKPVAKKAVPAKPTIKPKAAPVAAKPAPKPEPKQEAPKPAARKSGEADPMSLVSIRPAAKPVLKKEPPRPSKVVIPKLTTKAAIKYEPEFTKSVLDPMQENAGLIMRYSDAELAEFKEIILKKLDAAKKELAYLQGLITRRDEGGDMDEARYMTMEDGSVSMEREQLSQMASRQITFIDHLEKALMRIENKTYGICRVTGKLIDKARLRAVPHATLSIEAKQMMNK